MPEDRQSWIRSHTEPPVIDIGCGHSIYFWSDGEEARHIEQDVEYLGIDLHKKPLDTSINPDFGVPSNFIVGAAECLPVKTASYRTAVLAEVLEHCEDPVAAISEACRVSRDKVIITVTHEDGWEADIDFSDYDRPRRKYDKVKIVEHCVDAGLNSSQIEIEYTEDSPLAFWLVEIDLQFMLDEFERRVERLCHEYSYFYEVDEDKLADRLTAIKNKINHQKNYLRR